MPSRLQWIFLLDATLLVCICALQTVNFTGLIVHEWLGIATAILFVPHLLLAWAWIASATRRLFSRPPVNTRINYWLNLSLFACITIQTLSGIMISQQTIPLLTGKPAITLVANFAWDRIHKNASDFAVVLVSAHLAINWTWLVAAVRTRLGWRKAGTQ